MSVAGWTLMGHNVYQGRFLKQADFNCSLLKKCSKTNYFCNFLQALAAAAPLQTHLTAKFMMILLLCLAVSRLLLTILQPWETSWFRLCPAQGLQKCHPTLASVEINQEVCMQAQRESQNHQVSRFPVSCERLHFCTVSNRFK